MASAAVFALAVGTGLFSSLRNDGRPPRIDIAPEPHVRELASRGEWERVATELEASLRFGVGPQYRPQTLARLGVALAALGRHEEALARFRESIALRPDDLDIRRQLVNELASAGHSKELVAEIRALLERSPEALDARELLAQTLEQRGDRAGAALEYERALALQPDAAGLRVALAALRVELGDRDAAIAELRRGAELRPDDPVIGNNLAWLLATHPDPTARRPDEAVALAQRSAARQPGAEALDTLAAALAAAGRYADAAATAERAERLARDGGKSARADAIARRRARYLAGESLVGSTPGASEAPLR